MCIKKLTDFSCLRASIASLSLMLLRASSVASVRIAVVGDVHGAWNQHEDILALQFLRPDVVLFTGDFGRVNVALVRSIGKLGLPKALILGNHDARATQKLSNILGEEHVGYKRLDFPQLKLSVVGGRPFSRGGHGLFGKELLASRYEVHDMDESANRIFEAAAKKPEDHSLIMLAHNGPRGLGSEINDICGRDWVLEGGDHGDPDLERAISRLREIPKFSIPLVVFGHMHKRLAHSKGDRKMIFVGARGVIYLNAAVVPRVRMIEAGYTQRSPSSSSCRGSVRAFTVVDMVNGCVDNVAETWISVVGDVAALYDTRKLFDRKGIHCDTPLAPQ